LVSIGRSAYGLTKTVDIQRAAVDTYRLLGWSTDCGRVAPGLVGSQVTPTRDTVTTVLNFLALRTEHSLDRKDPDSIVDHLNVHAEWLAGLLALTLALRRRTAYPLPQVGLKEGRLLINEKAVHLGPGDAIRLCPTTTAAVRGWYRLCRKTVELLLMAGDARSRKLAQAIEERNADADSTEPIFTVVNRSALAGIGYTTWQQCLPLRLRVVANFGRHFWPLPLSERGVEQAALDIFLRHEAAGRERLHALRSKVLDRLWARLHRAINATMGELNLTVPAAFCDE
jgi:hypothetical protein